MISLLILSSTVLLASDSVKANDRPDIMLTTGRLLSRCKIISKSPSDAVVSHSKGVENISWELFPEEIRKKHNFSAEEANEYKSKITAINESAKEREKAMEVVSRQASRGLEAHLRVFQVTDGGFLAKGYAYIGPSRRERVTVSSSQKKGWGLTPNENVTKNSVKFVTKRDRTNFEDLIFISTDEAGIVDDQNVVLIVFSSGEFTYRTVLGSSKTVPQYTTDWYSLLSSQEKKAIAVLNNDQLKAAFDEGYEK